MRAAHDCRPGGAKTRPTQDYVRESLFNIIRWDVEDARVLDLFAGTGALLAGGSISRGARSAVLVDRTGRRRGHPQKHGNFAS